MRRTALCVFLGLFLMSSASASEVRLSVPPGGPMLDLAFDGLADPQDYGALGLTAKAGGFRLSEVPGDLLLLEFFNQLCMHCQRQAPLLQSFYQAAGTGELAGRVRVLTIGVGNRMKDLLEFRRRFQVSYPIAEDPTFDRFIEIGDPGGTPLTLFLLRRQGRWVLADSHMGLQGDTELLARARVLLEGKGGTRGVASLVLGGTQGAGSPKTPQATGDQVKAFLSGVSGQEVAIDSVELPGGVRVYRAIGPGGVPTGLYARISKREAVCDVCHAIQFLLAFDQGGTVRGFEPIYVTKYGNEEWNAEDSAKMQSRLAGRRMKDLSFEPQVDAVTSATMSSSLIFDEVRRSASLLDALGKK